MLRRMVVTVALLVGCSPGAERGGGGIEAPVLEFDYATRSLESLAGWYTFDGHADDLSDRANHGEIVGCEPTEDRFGRPDHALRFDGSDDHIALSDHAIDDKTRWFTVALWFRTSTDRKVTLFHEGQAQGPGIWVRIHPHDDTIVAHARDAFTLKTPESAYNDGAWHHLALKASDAGVSLWVDAALLAETEWSPDFTLHQTPHATVLGREGEPDGELAFNYYEGDLDDLAVFHRPLGGDEILALYKEGPNKQPTATADATRTGLDVSVNADGSGDSDGEIVGYSWDFGDGSEPKTGEEASHTYDEAGTYEVTLIVTDDEGATAEFTVTVEVEETSTDHPQAGPWDADWEAFEDEVLALVNQHRAAGATCADAPFAPAPALESNGLCRDAARAHAADMAEQGYFSHTGLDGSSPFDRMAAAGYAGPQPWGENIAAGQPNAASVVAAWMESPGHCRNIMEPGYEVLGVGYVYDSSSQMGHYWVQNFGGGH